MADTHIEMSSENIEALQELDLDGPIVMVNLLRFRPDGGRDRYREYGRAAMPFLERAGATIRYYGRGAATVIGGEQWDEVVLVEYPSLRAFREMTGDPDYPAALRQASLVDSRLYCTQESGRTA